MIFNPNDSEKSFDLGEGFEVGEADFTVKYSNDHVSPEGKKSIKVVSECTDTKGTSKLIDMYLSKGAVFRIREFCYATGMEELFKKGDLEPEDCLGKAGKCVTQVQKGTSYKDKDGIMQVGNDKIVIKYFVSQQKMTSTANANKEPGAEEFKEDDVPF